MKIIKCNNKYAKYEFSGCLRDFETKRKKCHLKLYNSRKNLYKPIIGWFDVEKLKEDFGHYKVIIAYLDLENNKELNIILEEYEK